MKCYKIKLDNHNVIIEGGNILQALVSFTDEPLGKIRSINEMK